MKWPRFNPWRWMAMGLTLGALVGTGRLLSASSERIGGKGFIMQRAFENDLRVPPIEGRPYLKEIVIHPAPSIDHIDIVSFKLLDAGSGKYQALRLVAPRPYFPTEESELHGKQYSSIAEYLGEQLPAGSAELVRHAWWEGWTVVVAIDAILGAIIVGGVGLIAPNRRGKTAIVSKRPKTNVSDAQSQAGSSASGVPRATVPSIAEAPPEPVEEPVVQEKEYAGRFYPVERRAPHGFTLLELLVVLAIITILSSFLLPTIRVIRLQAQTVRCAANLRQIGLALHRYADDNAGWLPAWSDWHTWPTGLDEDTDGPAWTIEMIPYLGSPDGPIYNCPSFPGPRLRNYFLAAQWAGRSGRNAMKLTDVAMASRFVLSGDKTNPSLYPPPLGEHPNDDADPDDFGAAGALLWPWTGGFYMHWKGNNVLFDDGHVALYSHYDPAAMTFNPHRMENWPDVTAD
ncbi:MAG TPA: prepilin-type N-terminal cleavage/methylation domain-containing protein [Tepidisphaeraceae bacterium]|nr:prepilin-type N-terminal cleavage/methylation domain-containing protein [Tepidisphaeraceae bacterium]